VTLIEGRLRPAAVDRQRILALAGELDSDQFTVREKALTELKQFGPEAQPVFREVLAGKPSAEVRKQLEALQEVSPLPVRPGEELRGIRAAAVLEQSARRKRCGCWRRWPRGRRKPALLGRQSWAGRGWRRLEIRVRFAGSRAYKQQSPTRTVRDPRAVLMAARSAPLLDYLHRLASQHGSDPAPDAVLFDRFLRGRDEAAFAALVARHGPMVNRLCRRVLSDAHAAEDAFQATFLVLARRAAAVRPPEVLAAWLHQVAYRVALKARGVGIRRRARETAVPDLAPADTRPDPLAELSARELLTILDEEVQRLPKVYRLPLIHCCLEGRSQEETAGLLGWTPGSVKGRLERGRARLHARLARRGLALTAALAAAEVARGAAGAAVSPALAASMAQASLRF
jgi:RNA polymerase sigma factor (sigma-70 family)